MTTTELILWGITITIVVTMLARSWGIFLDGCKWWLRPNYLLIIRLPIFLSALFCIAAGVELVYDINLRAWFVNLPNGHSGFRWWVIFFTPVVLTISGLGFVVPLLGYFLLVPKIFQTKKYGIAAKLFLSGLVTLGIPVLGYNITNFLT